MIFDEISILWYWQLSDELWRLQCDNLVGSFKTFNCIELMDLISEPPIS